MSPPQSENARWPKWLTGLLIIAAIPLALDGLFGFTSGDLYALGKLALWLVIAGAVYMAARRLWPSFGRLRTALGLILIVYALLVAACACIYIFPNTPGEGGMAYYWSRGFPNPDILDFILGVAVGLPWSLLVMGLGISGGSDKAAYGLFWVGIAVNLAVLLFFVLRRKPPDADDGA